jgi:hypothetical protein
MPAAALDVVPSRAPLAPGVPVAAPPADLADAPANKLLALIWRRFGGETTFDQAKSILAMIGLVSVIIVFLRFGSKKEVEHHDE